MPLTRSVIGLHLSVYYRLSKYFMAFFEITLLTVILYTIYLIWSIRKEIKCATNFRGPFALPFIGNFLQMRDVNKFFETVASMRSRYGSPFRFWMGPTLLIYSDDPEFLKIICHAKECISKGEVYRYIRKFLGEGIFVSDPPKWNEQRKALNPTFSNKILLSFYPIVNAEVDKFLKRLDEQVGRGFFDLEPLLQPCIMDITCQTTMGTKMNFQNGENDEFLQMFKIGKEISGMRISTPIYHFDRIFRLSGWAKIAKTATTTIQNFISDMVHNKIKERKLRAKLSSEKIQEREDMDETDRVLRSQNIFIDQALNVMDEQVKFTLMNVKENAFIMVGAAFDTTVHGVLYTIVCLAMNPDCQAKVIEEVRSIFPKKGCYISPEDTKNMIYTEMALNEALRLFPPVPLIARKFNEEFQLKPGVIIPKGLNLAIDIFNMHRNEKYWGPNAGKYNPDNFLPENLSKIHPYAFAPFSKGPRNCIGMRYAYNSMKVQLAKIFQTYRFTTKMGMDDFKFRLDITLTSIVQPLVEVHRQED